MKEGAKGDGDVPAGVPDWSRWNVGMGREGDDQGIEYTV